MKIAKLFVISLLIWDSISIGNQPRPNMNNTYDPLWSPYTFQPLYKRPSMADKQTDGRNFIL